MKQIYLTALALMGGATSLFAQTTQNRLAPSPLFNDNASAAPGRNCATMEVFEKQVAADPARAQRMEAIEAQTKRFMGQSGGLRRNTSTTGTVVTIPVVVHVVYNTAAQNVTDAMVADQIRVLNEDFARTNADASQTPSIFTASPTNVRFVLAKRTPTGATTTGIVRRATKTRSFSSNDFVKYTSKGGSDAWPREQYLNIWLCNLGQGLLGYAQFPGGAAATDGVVCLYSSVPGGSASNYNLGRTATHEVGHWLNLRHIWGDATCGNDFVSDTPTQQTSNGGCPVFPKITCNNQGDMSMNYMDYTYDKCMYMFTAGQSGRMDALFAADGARASLLTSTGGTALRQLASTSTLYPNPASDIVNVQLADNSKGSTSIRVYDLSGHEMTEARYNGNGQVQVSALPKGLYYIRTSSGGQTTHQRFEKE
jgi:hypothetical protein